MQFAGKVNIFTNFPKQENYLTYAPDLYEQHIKKSQQKNKLEKNGALRKFGCFQYLGKLWDIPGQQHLLFL